MKTKETGKTTGVATNPHAIKTIRGSENLIVVEIDGKLYKHYIMPVTRAEIVTTAVMLADPTVIAGTKTAALPIANLVDEGELTTKTTSVDVVASRQEKLINRSINKIYSQEMDDIDRFINFYKKQS